MSRAEDSNYSESEYLDRLDPLNGAVSTLEERVNIYVQDLDDFMEGDLEDQELKSSIYSVQDALERVYSSIDSFDSMMEDENLVARVEKDGGKGRFDFDKNLGIVTDQNLQQVDSFDSLITLMKSLHRAGTVKPDKEYMSRSYGETDAPTRIISDRDMLIGIDQRLQLQYGTLTNTEVIARRETKTDDLMQPYSPEPPIYRMLGHDKYEEEILELEKIVEEKQ